MTSSLKELCLGTIACNISSLFKQRFSITNELFQELFKYVTHCIDPEALQILLHSEFAVSMGNKFNFSMGGLTEKKLNFRDFGNCEALKNCKELSLNLSKCKYLEDDAMLHILETLGPNLVALSLSGTFVTGKSIRPGIQHCTKLRSLDLSHTTMDKQTFLAISESPAAKTLEYLDIRNAPLTYFWLPQVLARFTNLKRLKCYKNKKHDMALCSYQFTSTPSQPLPLAVYSLELEQSDLRFNENMIRSLKSLVKLTLTCTTMSEELFDYLMEVDGLRVLKVVYCELSERNLKKMSELRNLKVLWLQSIDYGISDIEELVVG